MGVIQYRRRPTRVVAVGGTPLGSDNPVRVQSMTTTRTADVESSVAQVLRLAGAGAEYVRLTAQGVREAEALGQIRNRVREAGCDVPLVADIHFNPKAAFAAAPNVEKIRINPGNFIDPGRVFKTVEYTDDEYAAELKRLSDALVPLLELCRANGTAIRLGVNHGSLSDRIMSRYGDTPEGMVESALEFLRVCRDNDFADVVVSIKASNPVVMVRTVRLLAAAMDREGMPWPLHLGVTEAGDGEDGRIKSAVGIGTLLCEGIGDTIRVSLSEDPCNEIPVARDLLGIVDGIAAAPAVETLPELDGEPYRAEPLGDCVAVVGADIEREALPEPVEALEVIAGRTVPGPGIVVLDTSHPNYGAVLRTAIGALRARGIKSPVVAAHRYTGSDAGREALHAAVDMGGLLLDNLLDGIDLRIDAMTVEESRRTAFTILQATRARITRTEYISCPGCGRTMFDLQTTLHRVREATSHLTGLKIGVMGCIVNGPGEMADADYGYVGAAAGHVSLYRGKVCVAKNISEAEAPQRLLELIAGDRADAQNQG